MTSLGLFFSFTKAIIKLGMYMIAKTNYKNYAIIIRYIMDKYGRDYVVGLIRNGKKINIKEIYDEFKRNS